MPDHDDSAPVGVLTLPDIAYETATVRERLNGTVCVFELWVNGPGCPGRVKAEYARKVRAFQLSTDAPQAAHIEFLTDVLLCVSKNMTHEQADLLAGDVDRATQIMTHTRWFTPVEDTEDDADPEAPAQGSTTGASSSISAPISAAPAPTAAAG